MLFKSVFCCLFTLTLASSCNAAIVVPFSIVGDPQSTTVFGTITGTINLPFVDAGGTATGSADSVLIIGLPAGFGILAGGNESTAWSDQLINIFTVTAGVLTSINYFAATNGTAMADILCMNSTATDTPDGPAIHCPSYTAGLSAESSLYAINFHIVAGIPLPMSNPAFIPEPSGWILLSLGVSVLALCLLMKVVVDRLRKGD